MIRANSQSSAGSAAQRAFTLIELLVVIAVVVLLIGILLPSLKSARDAARGLVCASTLRQLGTAMSIYASNNKDFIAGSNTSNADYQVDTNCAGDKTAETPTSSADWISPIMGDTAGLSINRAQRTKQIFEKFGCAGAKVKNDQLFGSATDYQDFERLAAEGGFGQVSYLSSQAWHYYPNRDAADKHRHRGIRLNYYHFTDPVQTNPRYIPNLNYVGTSPSDKVFASDGTRYFDGLLDFDIGVNPEFYGSFLDPGPTFHESRAFGRAAPGGIGINVKLSFRHPGETINGVYFDNSVRRMRAHDAWKDAAKWYPSGSIFAGGSSTPEATAAHDSGEVLR